MRSRCWRAARGASAAGHQLGWIECIKARKEFVDPIESAVRSDLISQLSDICLRTGRPFGGSRQGDHRRRRGRPPDDVPPDARALGALVRSLCILVAILLFAAACPFSRSRTAPPHRFKTSLRPGHAMLKDLTRPAAARRHRDGAALGMWDRSRRRDQARWQYLTRASCLGWTRKAEAVRHLHLGPDRSRQYSWTRASSRISPHCMGAHGDLALGAEQDFKPSDQAADTLRWPPFARWRCGAVYNVPVSLYPTSPISPNAWRRRRLAEKSGRPERGVTFNLCHWLRTDGADSMERVLKLAMPRLSLVTSTAPIAMAKRDPAADSATSTSVHCCANCSASATVARSPPGLERGQSISDRARPESQTLDRSLEALVQRRLSRRPLTRFSRTPLPPLLLLQQRIHAPQDRRLAVRIALLRRRSVEIQAVVWPVPTQTLSTRPSWSMNNLLSPNQPLRALGVGLALEPALLHAGDHGEGEHRRRGALL